MTDFTSVSLLQRVKTGPHDESWEQFTHLYDRIIRGWLYSQNVQPHDADDVVQDVMTLIYEEIPNFEHNGRPGAFRNWLRQVTVNRLRHFLRKQRRGASDVDFAHLADQLGDDDSMLCRLWQREHDRHVLEHLLSEVATRFTANSILIFRKIVLEEVPAPRVADEMAMSLGAVRVAQSRVLQALRELGEGLID